jgi:penicillin-binding protein 2
VNKDFENRKYVLIGVFILIGIIYSVRLFYIQVINDKYKLDATNNVIRHVTQYPARGIIYDRKGKIMVYNEPAYDLMVIPKQVKFIDTTLFCKILNIDKKSFTAKMDKAKAYSYYKPSTFEKQLSVNDYAHLQENLYQFKGFFTQKRTLRSYPDKIAGHLLGYVGEVNDNHINADSYYKSGDYIGISGVEKSYEAELRGTKGLKVVMVDVHNREKGSFSNGEYDLPREMGSDVYLTIDAELQKYGELLMSNKRGSIVAIEPSTGEILAMVSNPAYDPNLLVGRQRAENYGKLANDTLKPLFNRALMASYPPGSTFKLANALIGQQVGVLKESTRYACPGGYHFGAGKKVGCHAHSGPADLIYSIQTSCNAYYCHVFKSILDKHKTTEIGYEVWRNHLLSFGFGKKFETDLPSELRGLVPSTEYYDRYHGKGRWKPHTIISLAIGQGELGITPLQMANFSALLANRGYYVAPHLIKSINDSLVTKFAEKHQTEINKEYFDIVVRGMNEVVENGTGRGGKIPGITYCGKTGTAQNPHGKDHSIYIAFAPMDNPKIAIAVYVENAGFGATYGVPISSLMIEKYLFDSISRPQVEQRMIEANLIGLKKKI